MAYTPKSSNPGIFDVYKTGSKSVSSNKSYVRACSVSYAYDSGYYNYIGNNTIAYPLCQLADAPESAAVKTNDVYSYVFLKGFLVTDNNKKLLRRKCTIDNVHIAGYDGPGQSGPQVGSMSVTLNGCMLVPTYDTIPIADRIQYQQPDAEWMQIDAVYLSNFDCKIVQSIDYSRATKCYFLSHDGDIPSDFSAEQSNAVSVYNDITVKVLAMRLEKAVNQMTQQYSSDYEITDAIIQLDNNEIIVLKGNNKVRDDYFLNAVTNWGTDQPILENLEFWYDTDFYNVPTSITELAYDEQYLGISKLNTMLIMSSYGAAATSCITPFAKTITSSIDDFASYDIVNLLPSTMQQHSTTFTDVEPFEYFNAEDFDPDADWESFIAGIVVDYDYYYNGKIIINPTYSLYQHNSRNGLQRRVFQEDVKTIGLTDLTQDQIEKMEDLTEIPYASMTSEGLFITPMEYYEGFNANRVEGSLLTLENKVKENDRDIPVYFWVETLKNWCTYEYEKLTDWNGFARLKVWNGRNGWHYLDEILQQQRSCQMTITQMQDARTDYLAGRDPDKNLGRLNRYRNILVANSSLYRFPYEKLNTTVLQRVYTPTNEANWIVEDNTFFLVRVISKAVDYLADYAMMLVDWSPIGLIYNSYKDGIGSAFGAGWNRWTSTLGDIFGGIKALVSPVINWLFSDSEVTNTPEKRLKKIDTRRLLVTAAEYLFLPYDTGYSSNDVTTFQTIRFRNEWGADGIVSRTSLKAGHNIGNPIGSPLVVRSTTGELTLAVSMTYQGPWRQYYGDEDYKKQVGISQNDVDMTNKMLEKMFGDGKDKTASDYLNIRGGLLSSIALADGASLQTVMANDVVEQTNAGDSASCEITITANRSKTSSDVETPTINTLTKW